MKKNILSIVLLAGLVFSMTACGSSGDAEPISVPTVTVTAEPESAPTYTPEPEQEVKNQMISDDDFVLFVRDRDRTIRWSDDRIVDTAKQGCSDLETLDGDVMAVILREAIEEEDESHMKTFSQIFGAGVANYCPQYLEDLDTAMDNL